METIKLRNGVGMPVLGYGVFQITPEDTEKCVAEALNIGYRSIDTAQAYFNEEGVGNAIANSGIPREDVFITTKVWISNAGQGKCMKSIDESLSKLRTDYVDLLLIHQPFGDVYGSWRDMEKALKAGKARAIGVSNFQAGRFVDFCLHVDEKPMVNQLQCNTSVQQTGIRQYLDEFGTRLMAWSPLGGQGVDDVVKNPVLEIIGTKYGKSAAQVALRWLTQTGIIAIPKSSNLERMKQNLNIFNFTLSDDDLSAIATLNSHDSGTFDLNNPQFIKYLIETYG